MNHAKPIEVHIQTMHLMAPGSAVLPDSYATVMLGELAKVAEHFNFGSLAVEFDDPSDGVAVAAR